MAFDVKFPRPWLRRLRRPRRPPLQPSNRLRPRLLRLRRNKRRGQSCMGTVETVFAGGVGIEVEAEGCVLGEPDGPKDVN